MEVCVNFFEWKSSCLIDELTEEISDKIEISFDMQRPL